MYLDKFKGKKVGFAGIGISNMPLIEQFFSAGIEVTVRDKNEISNDFLQKNDVSRVFGKNYLDGITEDVLFITPAIRPDVPEILRASANGTAITGEMREFIKYCPAKTIGVTGSDGKTTTTTLIGKILEAAGKTVYVGGNIGVNLLSRIDKMTENDYAVAELSSFQLMSADVSPEIAVVTNISPNHLDWHTGMREYISAKKNIFKYNGNNTLILNLDDEITRSFASEARGKVIFISGTEILADGVSFDDKGIYLNGELILPERDILLKGRHNRYNYCAAIAAAGAEGAGVVAASFGGVEHRNELVRTLNGVSYYNSSIDSSPARTKAFLETFDKKIIIICGGYDKNIPLEPLGDLFVNRVKYAFLLGATAEKIEKVLTDSGFRSFAKVNSMEEAVNAAYKKAVSGDCVALSPAAASFGMFRNFEERGNIFKTLVNNL